MPARQQNDFERLPLLTCGTRTNRLSIHAALRFAAVAAMSTRLWRHHDDGVQIVYDRVKCPSLLIDVNQTCTVLSGAKPSQGIDPSAQRVYLAMPVLVKRRIYLADVKCLMDTELCIEDADARNQQHYKLLAELLMKKYLDFQWKFTL